MSAADTGASTNRGEVFATVVIPTYNRLSKLRSCIDSVSRSTVDNLEVIVVVDGSTDGTEEVIRTEYPSVRLIVHTRPTFAAGCINDGIRAAHSDLVLVLNDDNVVDRGMVAALAAFLNHNPNVAVVGPITYLLSQPALILYTGAVFTRLSGRTRFVGELQPDHGQFSSPFDVENIPNCFMIRRGQALSVGLIDSDIFVWTGEDGSLQDKLRSKCGRVVIVPAAKTWHDRDLTAAEDSEERLSAAKLYYTMRSKLAHIRLLDRSYMSMYLHLLATPAYLFYYSQLAARHTDFQELARKVAFLLAGTRDGILLKRGLPYV